MECKNCGHVNKVHAKFCSSCGVKLISDEQRKNRKVFIALISICFIFPILLVFSIIFGINFSMWKQGNIKYVNLGNDQISTIANVVGYRKIKGFSSYNNEKYSYDYNTDNLYAEDIEKYMGYLSSNGFYQVINDNTDPLFKYIKESSDEGYVILVSAIRYHSSYTLQYITITYLKVKGTLDDYEYEIPLAINMQEIGQSNYGFMQVPNDWLWYHDNYSGDSIQYISTDYNNLVTLNYGITSEYDLLSYVTYTKSLYEEDGYKCTLSSSKVSIYDAYLITAIDVENTNRIFKIWIFNDKNDYTHYISIATFENNSEVFDYINSYYLE